MMIANQESHRRKIKDVLLLFKQLLTFGIDFLNLRHKIKAEFANSTYLGSCLLTQTYSANLTTRSPANRSGSHPSANERVIRKVAVSSDRRPYLVFDGA